MEIIIDVLAIALLISGVVLVGWGIMAAFDRHTPGSPATIPVGIVLILVGLFSTGVKVVPPGEVGVVITAGVVNDTERQPGISWVTPFIDDVKTFDVRVQALTFDKVTAASKEYQDVFLSGTINYHIDPNGAAELYKTVGDDYANKLVTPFFTDIVKEIVPQYNVGDVLANRDAIRKATVTELSTKLTPYGLYVDDVALTNIDFNEEYNNAIKEKQVQEVNIQTQRNITQQRLEQAKQTQADAKGQADAKIEQARGEAESIRITREAEAEGNKAVAASLTQPILTQMAIDKLNPNVKIVLMPAGSDGQNFLFPSNIIDPEATAAPVP